MVLKMKLNRESGRSQYLVGKLNNSAKENQNPNVPSGKSSSSLVSSINVSSNANTPGAEKCSSDAIISSAEKASSEAIVLHAEKESFDSIIANTEKVSSDAMDSSIE